MPTALINGVTIYYEEAGDGFPLVWCHEFAGNCESWAEQVRFFRERYQVITWNCRGYPPSTVPDRLEDYSQKQNVDDLYGLLRHLGIRQAYIGGLSMGGAHTLVFGLEHPEMAKALVVAGAGTGSTDPERYQQEWEAYAARLEAGGMRALEDYIRGPARVQLLRKDPDGWRKFADAFFEHSALGSAMTFRGVQARRPSIFSLEERLEQLQVPTLIMVGDEDEPCLEPALFMKRHIPGSGLAAFPQSGHAINLEEPELFNRSVLTFLEAVEAGRWAKRA